MSAPSIIGAEDRRSASVAAFKGIKWSPEGRSHSDRARVTYHMRSELIAPPCPLQRQASGGDWAGLIGLSCHGVEENRNKPIWMEFDGLASDIDEAKDIMNRLVTIKLTNR